MATLSSSLVKKLVSVTNDSSSTATSSGTAYGTVTVSGDRTYVLIDGGTTITPVVAGADARDQDRVIVTIENHTATITSNLTNPASSYTASETEEAITDYLTDESEDGYLSVVGAYIGDLTVDTAYIETLLADYAQISYLEGDYLSYVEGYIGTLTSDSIIVTNLLANYATIDYLTGDYLEYVDGRIGTLTSKYITTEYLTTNYITSSTIDSQYANIELLNVSTESVKNLFVSVGVLTDATIEDAYITGMLNGVRINADVITAGTLSVDRLLITGEDSIVYQINVNSSGLSYEELEDEVYQSYLNGTDIVANSITATQIAAGTITASEINTSSLAASEAFLTTLTAQTAFIDAIETNTVVVGAVETAAAAIANQDILYTITSSATTAPDSSAVWSSVQPDKVSGVYIWMKIVNTYGNGTTYTSTPVCISGLDGEDGISGASVAISASTVSYAISTSGSTVPTTGWTESLPTASNGQYLWTRTEITYELTDADGNTTDKTTTSYGVSYVGVDGTDGTSVDISTSAITYCASTNGTTAPTSGTWTTTIPSVSNGQYLWTKTEITYNTGDVTTSYSVSYIGVDGENGTDGIGITSVANYYALSTSGSVSPTSWSTDVLEMTLTDRYLWNYETKYYSDGSSDSTTPHVIGVYGATGADGEDGVGISGITEYYAVSSSSSTAPTTWSTTLQTMTVTYKYLWNYETVAYTNGTSEDSIARVIGVYGNTGSKGDTGDAGADGSSVTIGSTTISYIASSSGTTVPSGTWSSSVPSVSNGQYLWTRTEVIYYLTASDGTLTTETTTSYSVAYIGTNGTDGTNGEDGTSVSISGTEISYCISSSGTVIPSGTWSTSVPSVNQGQYLWTKTVVTYSTGDTTESYGVSYIGTDGQDGADGSSGSSFNWNILRGTNTATSLTSTGSWDDSEWRAWSGGTDPSGTREYVEVSDAPVDGLTCGWFLSCDSGSAYGIAQNYIPVTIGNTYTVSCYARGTGTLREMVGSGTYTEGRHTLSDITSWTQYSFTFTADSTYAPDGVINSYFGNASSDTIEICGMKLESGSTASDWCCAQSEIYGTSGSDGEDGVSVTNIEEYYALSTSATSVTGTWSNSIPTMTSTNKYLWNYEIVYYSDGTSQILAQHLAGVYGDTGEDGVGIADTANYYALSTSGTSVTGTWSTTVPTLTSTYKYLWNYEFTTYTDGTTYTSEQRVIGVYGDTGDSGSSFNWNILRGTNTATSLTSTGSWDDSEWRAWSGGTDPSGTREYVEVSDAPVDGLTCGWFLSCDSGSAYGIAQNYIPVTIGNTYTVSCYARGTGTLREMVGSGTYTEGRHTLSDITSWTQYSFTFTADSTYAPDGVINSYFGNASSDTIEICGMKLESGSTASDWCCAQSEIYGTSGSDGEDGTTLYATCITAAATAAKVATITPTKSNFELTTGTTVSVKFSYTNTASSPTLEVNGTGAYAIYYKGAAITASYIVASMTLTFCFNGSEWEYTGYVNTDTTDRTQFSGAVKASAAIASGNIIVGNSSGYHQLNAGTSFDISYPILYAGSAISSGSTGTNNYTEINFTVTATQSISLTAYKYVYIVGTLSASTFIPEDTTPLTQTVPTSSDGLYYICLGLAYSTTGIHLDASHEIFMYYGGQFQSLGANSQRIIASWCSINDETLIDGGHIYTGSIDTEQLAASCITTDKLSANCVTTAKLKVGTGGNMYPNYDTFENITNEVLYYSITDSYATAEITSEEAYYGTQCCKITTTEDASSTNYGRVYLGHQSNGYGCIPVIEGTYYRISCYAKCDSTASLRLGIVTHVSRSNVGYLNYYTTATIDTSWSRLEYTFTSASSSYPFISVFLQVNTADVAVYVDAIQIEIVSADDFETTDFSPAGTTMIDGSNLITGTVTADAIDVTSLFAQTITFTGSIMGTGTDSDGNEFEVYILPGSNTNNDFLVVHNVTDNTYPFFVRANGTAAFGNWTVSKRKIYGGSSSTGVAVMQAPSTSTTYVFAAGGTSNDSYADCPFRVTKAGKMYATSAVLENNVYIYDEIHLYGTEETPVEYTFAYGANGYIYQDTPTWFQSTVHISGEATFNGKAYHNATLYAYQNLYGYAGADNAMFGVYNSSTNGYTFRVGYSSTDCVGLANIYASSINFLKSDTTNPGAFTVGSANYPWNIGFYGNVYANGSIVHSSDERIKIDWGSLDSYDSFFDQLNPQRYRYKHETSGKYHLGFGAQSVLSALEATGLTEDDFAGLSLQFDIKQEGNLYGYNELYGLSYDEFIALIVYEVQQLKSKIQTQAAEIEVLQAQLVA